MTPDRWVDQSGNARDFTQATGTNQPSVTSAQTLLFDGADNYMTATFTLAQPYTVYGLFRQVTWTSLDRVVTGSAAALVQAGATKSIRFSAGTAIGLDNYQPELEALSAFCFVGNGASSAIRMNALAPTVANAGTGAISNPFLASTTVPDAFGNIDNYEWIFYNTAHSTTQQASLLSYLAVVGGLSL